MNEMHFIYKIRQHLNRGLYELPSSTVDRLAAAREKALKRQKQTVTASVLATAGSFFHVHVDSPRYKQLIAALVLAGAAVLTTFWMADQRVNELSEIDSALLADELPVKAFTDKGFNAWLKQASP